jgi:hypothetical protein
MGRFLEGTSCTKMGSLYRIVRNAKDAQIIVEELPSSNDLRATAAEMYKLWNGKETGV